MRRKYYSKAQQPDSIQTSKVYNSIYRQTEEAYGKQIGAKQ